MNYFNFVKYIEINPTELCNLQCSFCPRAHGYPNQNLHMSLDTAREIKNQLDNLHFKGKVIFAGRGEPTLTKNFDEILDIFLENAPNYRVQVTTNGKKIDALKKFFNDARVRFSYDIYTPDESEANCIIKKYNEYSNIRLIRKPDYGLNFDQFTKGNGVRRGLTGSKEGMTNRGGFLGENTFDEFEDNTCAKLVYNMYIDWNGNYNLCCDDWNPLILGNIFEENIEEFINYNENLNGYRKKHFCENSREGLPACQTCNRRSPVTGDNREDYMNLIRMNEM
jgi:MoaA/NifB/PqqE/SkfB family radical SAM enzyme